jgi:hypothetical protein
MASANVLSFVFCFSRKISSTISIRGIIAWKQLIPRAGAELCAKQYHLLHKLHGGAELLRVEFVELS